MKKWPFLLLLSGAIGVALGTHSLVRAQAAPVQPRIETQAELDDFALQHPDANFDRLGHAYANAGARLFWNTDLEAARRQAAREGKPILALRLLGNLSDEYSCANSRFFRVVFYPQAQINQRLRRDFVLFWSSERPVPVVTIDMGDGRVLKRTITGNSAHYLLDSNGRPLDVFPGLTTPAAFDSWLASAAKLAQDFKAQPQAEQAAWLAQWHTDKLREALTSDTPSISSTTKLDLRIQDVINSNPLEATTPITPVAARAAAPVAVSKLGVEGPLLNSFGLASFLPPRTLPPDPNLPPVLDAATRDRIRAMNPLAEAQNPLGAPLQNVALAPTAQKNDDTRFQALIRSFEARLRADTRQNQNLSIPIHALFARGHEGDLTSLNRRIYDRLFLTPRSDPWLGLTADTTFSALQNDGVTIPSTPTAGNAAN